MLRVDNVTKRYGEITAADKVGFQVESGEIVGLLGPNGAGKTTVLRIATGYIYPDEGDVFVLDTSMLTNPVRARRYMGYLPEFSPLYQSMRVRDFLEFAGGTRDLPGFEIKERIDEVSDKLAIRDQLDRQISKLSKGYQQRVCFAQALLHDPEYLILDEPTTGLDPNQILEFRNLIREIGEERTVLLSTHILQEVSALCERVMIIQNGSIVANGSQEDLRRRHGQNVLRVSVRRNGTDPDQISKEIEQMAFAESVTRVENEDSDDHPDRFEVEISGDDMDEPGEELYNLAREQNWRVTELSHRRSSLEEVFARLTRGDQS